MRSQRVAGEKARDELLAHKEGFAANLIAVVPVLGTGVLAALAETGTLAFLHYLLVG